ncbi:hypothetical protein KC316_g20661, partial [Hortaea werneckii]
HLPPSPHPPRTSVLPRITSRAAEPCDSSSLDALPPPDPVRLSISPDRLFTSYACAAPATPLGLFSSPRDARPTFSRPTHDACIVNAETSLHTLAIAPTPASTLHSCTPRFTSHCTVPPKTFLEEQQEDSQSAPP